MPLLDIFWSMLLFFAFVAWLMVLFSVLTDLFRSDMGGWAKAFWIIFMIITPFLGVLVYLISQGRAMAERSATAAAEADQATKAYIRDAAGTATPAEELEKLAALHDSGKLTDEEFATQKARVLA